jgi:hypothetical protein
MHGVLASLALNFLLLLSVGWVVYCFVVFLRHGTKRGHVKTARRVVLFCFVETESEHTRACPKHTFETNQPTYPLRMYSKVSYSLHALDIHASSRTMLITYECATISETLPIGASLSLMLLLLLPILKRRYGQGDSRSCLRHTFMYIRIYICKPWYSE